MYSEEEVLNILYLLKKREIESENEEFDVDNMETIEEWFNKIKK